MGYLTKKQLDEHKSKLTNLQDYNTKLRKQLREMRLLIDTPPLEIDTSVIEQNLKQAETTLANTKATLANKDSRIDALSNKVIELRVTIKSNVVTIENCKSSISKYRTLGFWGKIAMAFKSKRETLSFFFD